MSKTPEQIELEKLRAERTKLQAERDALKAQVEGAKERESEAATAPDDRSTIEVKSHMPRHHTIGAGSKNGKIVLVPGTNAVLARDWDKVKNLRVVQHYLALGKEGGLVEGEKTVAGALPERPGDAVRLIGECLDLSRLREWEKTATHGGIKRAITDQITKIEKARTPDKKTDDKE